MPQNITENPTRGSTVVAPSSGDPVTDGSIIQGEQPLADRIAHLEGFDLSSGQRALIHEYGGAGLAKIRMYAVHTGAKLTWQRTFNAEWNGSQWVADIAGFATLWQEGNGGVAMRFASAATTAGGWSDAEFLSDASLGLGFDPSNEIPFFQLAGGNLPVATAPVSNALYANNVPKAWGKFTTDGVGGVTLTEGFNCSVAINANDVRVTLLTPMADNNYHVSKSHHTSNPHHVVGPFNQGTSVFDLRLVDMSGVTQSLSTNSEVISFAVIGNQ